MLLSRTAAAPIIPSLRLALLRWPVGARRTRVLLGLAVALAVLVACAGYLIIAVLIAHRGERFVNRMFLFWGWSRFVHSVAPPALIYDPPALYHFEMTLPGAHPKDLPFAYPPPLLLLIWPLGWLRPVPALLAWYGVGLAAFIAATWQRRAGVRIALLALIAPSTLVALYYAQNSFLVAALLIGGWRLLPRRPVLAGVLFGLMAFKPQFGLLLPIVLISARQWTAIVAAAVTVAAMTGASVAAFGLACWTRLPVALAGLSAVVAAHPRLDHLAPTVTAGMRLLDAGTGLTQITQILAALTAAALMWRAARGGVTPLVGAALMAAVFLATPYAFLYDLPLLSYAALAVVRDRHDAFSSAEVLVLLAAIALPVAMLFNPLGLPWGTITAAAMLGLILRRIRTAPRSAPRHPAGSPPLPAPAAALASS